MLPATVPKEKEALNQRLEAIGWGLLFIVIGLFWIAPAGLVPQGGWLIVAGMIVLGVNAVRYFNGIKMSGPGLILGTLALILGAGELVGIDLPFVAILLIVLGTSIILRPWIDPLLERKRT